MRNDSFYYTKEAAKRLDNIVFQEILSFLRSHRLRKDEMLVAQMMTCYKRDCQRVIIRSPERDDKVLYDECIYVLNSNKACNKNVNIMNIEEGHILIFSDNEECLR